MPKSQAVNRSDWLLLALRAAKEGLTAVQLQKALFVLADRRKPAVGSGFYRFVPYNYGPFCQDIYSDADVQALLGHIEIDTSQGRSLRRYRLTPEGRKAADQAAVRAPAEGVSYLGQVVAWAQSLSFNELIRSVYQAYPEMRANSVFQDYK